MYIYVRFMGEYFETKTSSSIKKLIEIAMKDIKLKRALPCSIIDDHGNVLYNKKELCVAIEEYCLRKNIDTEFAHIWNKN